MASTHDDGFHEIQLSGKQLVFWAMAVVVIGVVVFLLGVQVGRGVLAQRGLPEATSAAPAPETDPPPAPAATNEAAAPITAGEKLSYAERLSSSEPTPEKLVAPPVPKAEAPERIAAATTNPTSDTGAFSIQVAALREREEADTIVKRLAAKGYPAYVAAPIKEKVPIFRVRVGKYKDRSEADTVAAKLQKEEQFKPWVVR
ncbi:MAG TPA: SPOR domain-containing protein [Vicinamibacterales bacterium]|nr:SPOR domain-containing protein [Vicinamibacterales bacterium]